MVMSFDPVVILLIYLSNAFNKIIHVKLYRLSCYIPCQQHNYTENWIEPGPFDSDGNDYGTLFRHLNSCSRL